MPNRASPDRNSSKDINPFLSVSNITNNCRTWVVTMWPNAFSHSDKDSPPLLSRSAMAKQCATSPKVKCPRSACTDSCTVGREKQERVLRNKCMPRFPVPDTSTRCNLFLDEPFVQTLVWRRQRIQQVVRAGNSSLVLALSRVPCVKSDSSCDHLHFALYNRSHPSTAEPFFYVPY